MLSLWLLIPYPHQAQSLRRGEGACGGSVFGLDNSRHLLGRPSARADLDQRSDNIADHIVQERVALDIHVYPVIFGGDFAAEDRADGILPVVGGGSQLATIGTLRGVFNLSPEVATSCGIMLWLVTFMSVIPAGLVLAHFERVSLLRLEEESLEEEGKALEEQ